MKIKMKQMKGLVVMLAALALTICLMPTIARADVTKLAAPKDAKQTAAQENGIKVSWTPVTGAKSYVYSYSADGKTFTAEAPTGNSGADNFVILINNNWKAGADYYVKVRAYDGTKYSEAVTVKAATAPKKPTSIKQTAADNGSVTVSWDKSEGATGYLIRFGTTQGTAKDYATVTSTSCKLTGLAADTQYYIAVFPVRKVSASYSASYDCVEMHKIVTTAGAVTGLKLSEWDVRTNQFVLNWNNTAKFESGYQIEIYSADGSKLLKTYRAQGRRAKGTYFTNKKLKNTPFQFRVRTYTTLSGQPSYGAWSEMAAAVPQANVKAVKKSDTSVQLTWDKVPGAKNYTIYRATKDGGKYKKIGTSKKARFTVKNLKTYQDYFFYVKANKVKVGGKYVNSNAVDTTNDINVYINKYQTGVTEE